MAKQSINLGTAPTGTGGDTPRTAFQKAIDNFTELYAALGVGTDGALPAVLPLAKGGTGVATMAALLSALNAAGNFSRANILGTVSMASGVPSGAIIERAANANGVYIKYADGSMTCFKLISGSIGVTSGYGSSFASTALGLGSFAAPFARVDNFDVLAQGADGACTVGFPGAPTLSSWPSVVLLNPVSGAKQVTFYCRADGVWTL